MKIEYLGLHLLIIVLNCKSLVSSSVRVNTSKKSLDAHFIAETLNILSGSFYIGNMLQEVNNKCKYEELISENLQLNEGGSVRIKILNVTLLSDKIQNNQSICREYYEIFVVNYTISWKSYHSTLCDILLGTYDNKGNHGKRRYIICFLSGQGRCKEVDEVEYRQIVDKFLTAINRNNSASKVNRFYYNQFPTDKNMPWNNEITASNRRANHFKFRNGSHGANTFLRKHDVQRLLSENGAKDSEDKLGQISYLYEAVDSKIDAPFLAWIIGPKDKTCLSSVISYRWIITNGICIEPKVRPGTYKVFAGFQDNKFDERMLIEVHHYIWDQPDGEVSSYFDIATSVALAKTDYNWDVQLVKGISLPRGILKSHIEYDKTCKVWGFATHTAEVFESDKSGSVEVDQYNLPADRKIRYISLIGVRTANECTALYGIKYNRELCVIYPQGKTDIANLCHGDSGAPLVCQNELIGIYIVKNDRMICQVISKNIPVIVNQRYKY